MNTKGGHLLPPKSPRNKGKSASDINKKQPASRMAQ